MGRGQDILGLIVAVVGTEAVGVLSAVVSDGDFERFFRELKKPADTPPSAAFGPAWTVLCVLLLPYLGWVGFAAYLNAGIWRLNRGSAGAAA